MSSTPSNSRSFVSNPGLGIKIAPSISPFPRTPKSPYKSRGLYEPGLSLKRIIGTTVSSPTAFDSLSSSRIFAYTAGAAAVVINIDDTSKHSQRFYRARPTAIPINANATSFSPSTPTNTANDGRNRAVAALRDSAVPYSPSTPHTSLDLGSDSPNSKTWTSRERIKAATCLSICRDGKLLAVGETGYSPRVLIFSLQDTSSDTPLAILNEHTYGVRAVAFSPDGRFLASLGSPNDGFIYVWSINQRTGAAKLHSSNKCTSFIKHMIWLGNNIVTIGTRHVKIWRVEDSNRSSSPVKPRYALDGSPQPMPVSPLLKTLCGRNILLGPLVEATFTAIAAISEHKALVCSEKGDVCLFDDIEGQKMIRLTNVGFSITCLAIDIESGHVRIGGRNGNLKSIDLDDLLQPLTPPDSPTPSEEFSAMSDAGHYCAMGYAARSLVTVDSKHSIEISSPNSDVVELKMEDSLFPAHGDAVLGVRLLSAENDINAQFLTWSANGTIVFWDLDGRSKASMKLEIEQLSLGEEDSTNQCLVVRISAGAKFLVAGDKYGVLRFMDLQSQKCTFEARAHSSDIHDIALFEDNDMTLVATCSRDRTIQLFRLLNDEWTLIQTLDEHSASVSSIFFAENGVKLVSCSTDRTIHIRQIVKKEVNGQDVIGAVPSRIITLKASPVSMAGSFSERTGNFVVSFLDRTVAIYEISSGRLIQSFRATDNDGADAVVLDSLVMGVPSSILGKPTILAGVSSTDKSVRIYDGATGSFLDREWGHTASVTDVALLEHPDSDQKTLISTGSDGTIMIWDLSTKPIQFQEPIDILVNSCDPSTPRDAPSSRPPLRKVLSKAELAEFQRSSPTPTNRSPPRTVRRKNSRYNISSNSPNLVPPVPTINKHFASAFEDTSNAARRNTRNRSRSPPPSPRSRNMRRPSLTSLNTKTRTKSAGSSFSEFGSLNMATEQTCRQLRMYRKKLLGSESIKEEALRELDQELRLTAIALGEKTQKSKIGETLLSGLLDQYSDKLVTMFDEKLRLARTESPEAMVVSERPKTAGGAAGNV